MKAIKIIIGVILIMLGLAFAAGRKDTNPDGTVLTSSQRAQDYFGIGAFVLIGASLIRSRRKKEE
jgi:uncharacterized membrane protein